MSALLAACRKAGEHRVIPRKARNFPLYTKILQDSSSPSAPRMAGCKGLSATSLASCFVKGLRSSKRPERRQQTRIHCNRHCLLTVGQKKICSPNWIRRDIALAVRLSEARVAPVGVRSAEIHAIENIAKVCLEPYVFTFAEIRIFED